MPLSHVVTECALRITACAVMASVLGQNYGLRLVFPCVTSSACTLVPGVCIPAPECASRAIVLFDAGTTRPDWTDVALRSRERSGIVYADLNGREQRDLKHGWLERLCASPFLRDAPL